jgi:thiol:disulfide interchange protein DsbA
MRALLRTLLASLTLLTAFACSAETGSGNFKEGEQYKKVRQVQDAPDPRRVTVEEVFWYGCQHCFHFDPTIEAWKARKPGDVDFARIPSSLGRPEGVVHQKAFYTAEALGVSDKIHKPLFDGIHKQGLPLVNQAALADFFNRQTGVLPDVFNSTFTGFTVGNRVQRAETLIRAYGIASVPTIVVGGKYYTNASLAGDFDGMIKVTDFLIEKVRQERKK